MKEEIGLEGFEWGGSNERHASWCAGLINFIVEL